MHLEAIIERNNPECKHLTFHEGPRFPRRYGSAPSDVCEGCGAFRVNVLGLGEWQEGPISKVIEAIEVDV